MTLCSDGLSKSQEGDNRGVGVTLLMTFQRPLILGCNTATIGPGFITFIGRF